MHGELGTTVCSGEFTFAYQHPTWVCEVHEEAGAPTAENTEAKHDEVSGMSKLGIAGRNLEGNGGSSQGKGHSFHN